MPKAKSNYPVSVSCSEPNVNGRLTLDEVGRSADLDPADISRWESSTRKPPERPIVVRISRPLDSILTPLKLGFCSPRPSVSAMRTSMKNTFSMFVVTGMVSTFEKTGNRASLPVKLGSPEWLNRHVGRHLNPIFAAVDDAEMVEQLMKVIRKSGWQTVSVLQQDGTIQDIVRKGGEILPEGLAAEEIADIDDFVQIWRRGEIGQQIDDGRE